MNSTENHLKFKKWSLLRNKLKNRVLINSLSPTPQNNVNSFDEIVRFNIFTYIFSIFNYNINSLKKLLNVIK